MKSFNVVSRNCARAMFFGEKRSISENNTIFTRQSTKKNVDRHFFFNNSQANLGNKSVLQV